MNISAVKQVYLRPDAYGPSVALFRFSFINRCQTIILIIIINLTLTVIIINQRLTSFDLSINVLTMFRTFLLSSGSDSIFFTAFTFLTAFFHRRLPAIVFKSQRILPKVH